MRVGDQSRHMSAVSLTSVNYNAVGSRNRQNTDHMLFKLEWGEAVWSYPCQPHFPMQRACAAIMSWPIIGPGSGRLARLRRGVIGQAHYASQLATRTRGHNVAPIKPNTNYLLYELREVPSGHESEQDNLIYNCSRSTRASS